MLLSYWMVEVPFTRTVRLSSVGGLDSPLVGRSVGWLVIRWVGRKGGKFYFNAPIGAIVIGLCFNLSCHLKGLSIGKMKTDFFWLPLKEIEYNYYCHTKHRLL